MSDLLPEALHAMLRHAAETHAEGNVTKAETEYLLAVEYSSKIHHPSSATTGLVLLELIQFYEATAQKSKAALAVGRMNAILIAYGTAEKPL